MVVVVVVVVVFVMVVVVVVIVVVVAIVLGWPLAQVAAPGSCHRRRRSRGLAAEGSAVPLCSRSFPAPRPDPGRARDSLFGLVLCFGGLLSPWCGEPPVSLSERALPVASPAARPFLGCSGETERGPGCRRGLRPRAVGPLESWAPGAWSPGPRGHGEVVGGKDGNARLAGAEPGPGGEKVQGGPGRGVAGGRLARRQGIQG